MLAGLLINFLTYPDASPPPVQSTACSSVSRSSTLQTNSAATYSDMVSRGKPHPDIFLLAADKLGMNPGSCLVIEDSASGIKAAVAAGMTAVGLCAASHVRDGHQLRLREAGALHLANSWDEVEKIAPQFLDGASHRLPA